LGILLIVAIDSSNLGNFLIVASDSSVNSDAEAHVEASEKELLGTGNGEDLGLILGVEGMEGNELELDVIVRVFLSLSNLTEGLKLLADSSFFVLLDLLVHNDRKHLQSSTVQSCESSLRLPSDSLLPRLTTSTSSSDGPLCNVIFLRFPPVF
jgi:hypothetical protein